MGGKPAMPPTMFASVTIDADGRKHPVVSYNPSNDPETPIIETQTFAMQEVHSPFFNRLYNGLVHTTPHMYRPAHELAYDGIDHGWTKATRAGWAVPPPGTSLSSSTNDVSTAVGYLLEGYGPTSVTTAPHSHVTVPTTTGPRRYDYCQTIDSREAAKRYGNLRSSPVPEKRYTGTIDSRVVARKYGGAAV